MILSSHGIIGSQIVQFSGLLDTYTGAAAAYSLRLLSTSYTGYAIKVRRASDNTEQDIGFSNNELDTTSLASFCSGTDGFVTTWYDQSGNGRNATQATAADQPKIYDSSTGVITENSKPAIKFLSNKLETTIFTSSSQPITRMFVGKSIAATNDFIDGSALNRGFTGNNGGINRLFAGTIFDTGTFLTTQQLFYGLFNGASSEIVVNGVSQGTGNAGASGLDQVILGSHPTVRIVDLDGTMQEVIVYASNQNTNRTGIETNINDFYSIY